MDDLITAFARLIAQVYITCRDTEDVAAALCALAAALLLVGEADQVPEERLYFIRALANAQKPVAAVEEAVGLIPEE